MLTLNSVSSKPLSSVKATPKFGDVTPEGKGQMILAVINDSKVKKQESSILLEWLKSLPFGLY